MSSELLRYHRLLDEAAGDPEVADRVRAAVAAVQRELSGSATASTESTTSSTRGPTALPGSRPALEPPTLRQVPYEVER